MDATAVGDSAFPFPNWMFDGYDQDFPLVPIEYTTPLINRSLLLLGVGT